MAVPHFSRGQPVRVLLAGRTIGSEVEPVRDAFLNRLAGQWKKQPKTGGEPLRIVTTRNSNVNVTAAELAEIDVVVLECTRNFEAVIQLIEGLKRFLPDLIIIVINGELSDRQKGRAFHVGVTDYFPLTNDALLWELLYERIGNLTRRTIAGPKFAARRRPADSRKRDADA